jgi:hypothetical protein
MLWTMANRSAASGRLWCDAVQCDPVTVHLIKCFSSIDLALIRVKHIRHFNVSIFGPPLWSRFDGTLGKCVAPPARADQIPKVNTKQAWTLAPKKVNHHLGKAADHQLPSPPGGFPSFLSFLIKHSAIEKRH